MPLALRIILVGALCAMLAGLVVVGLTSNLSLPGWWSGSRESRRVQDRQAHAGRVSAQAADRFSSNKVIFPLFSGAQFENAGYPEARMYTGSNWDHGSIEQSRLHIGGRARRAIDDQLRKLEEHTRTDPEDRFGAVRYQMSLACLYANEADFAQAAAWAERAMATCGPRPRELRANLEALLGVIHLRNGELENCLECRGPSSCILPIEPAAVHQKPEGSREAIRRLTAYLEVRPEDIGVRWLLNLAYMTVGEYPSGVPEKFLIPIDRWQSKLDVGRFENIAPLVGLGTRGPNMAGGSIFDDFTGDGLPDVLTTSFDADSGASFYVNLGDGTFRDESGPAGLLNQPLAINAAHADYNNDGRLDVVLLRGGWEEPGRLTLLRNKGGGRFEDVTVAAGLAEPISCQSAAWGDYDNDGWLDLFVCGEQAVDLMAGLPSEYGVHEADPRNRCRLYRNRRDGTFVDVAALAGVTNDRFAKGAAWGDYDNDGFLDLYVSNNGQDNRLYHNRGDGTFEDVAPDLGVVEPVLGFACWFWDFDNDGRLDLFVNDFGGTVSEAVASTFERLETPLSHPRLYRNLGSAGFREVSSEVGLDRVALAMGANFGDIDNDGFLDIYLATGRPAFSALLPNLMFKNLGGKHFEDVTAASRTGHLQKGHGVSFADWDCDGDLDLFVELGGAVPGDRAYNVLFQNPGHGRHWLKLKLVGTRTNRSALGARIKVDFAGPDGVSHSVYRQVGGGSSFGGNSLVESIGLGDAGSVAAVTITWPVSRSIQTFRNLKGDQLIEIAEGADATRVLTQPPLPGPPRS